MKKITFLIVACFVTLFSFAQISEVSNSNVFESIADFMSNDVAKEANVRYSFTCDLTVAFVSGKNFYVTDGNSYIHGFDKKFDGKQGDVLTGFTAKWNDRFMSLEDVTLVSSVKGIYTCRIITSLDDSYINGYVGCKKVLVSVDSPYDYPAFTLDGVTISIDIDKFYKDFVFEDGKYYDVNGIYGLEDYENEIYCVLYLDEAIESVAKPTDCSIVEMNGVEFDGMSILNPNHISIAVFTSNGKLVMQSKEMIDMTNQPQGVYMVLTPAGTIKIAK